MHGLSLTLDLVTGGHTELHEQYTLWLPIFRMYVGGRPCRNGSKLMALQPPTGISLECLKKRATKDMLKLFVTSFLLVSMSYYSRGSIMERNFILFIITLALGPNAASLNPEGAHGGNVASPVQLVKLVVGSGSCDVLVYSSLIIIMPNH